MRRTLASLSIYCALMAAHAFSQCNVDAYVTKGTYRLSGNAIEGVAYAWADAGDWWNWYADVYGAFYFQPPSGAPVLQATGSASGPLGTWYDVSPVWVAQATLEPRGDGSYFVEGVGEFTCNGYTYYGVNYGVSPGQAVTRPVISPPNSLYGSDRWAFWYLSGAPSIDGYYVAAALSADDKLSQSNYNGPTPNYQWQGVDKASKISLGQQGSTNIIVTSEGASDATEFDISLKFLVDGFSSQKFWLHINKPVQLAEYGYKMTFDHEGIGYVTQIQYQAKDMWGNALVPITANETHGGRTPGENPPTVGWPWPPESAVWNSDDPLEWDSTNNAFIDSMWAYDPTRTWRPLPVPPAGLNSRVEYAPQGLYIGSGTSGQGVLVSSRTQTWYTDHAAAQ